MAKIDFVITWVDMDDPLWKAEFERYAGKIDNRKNEVSEARFRDYGFLKYWFRGVERFAPWVNKIHFVTCGQKPDWLNENNPKLNLVHHKDYIPEDFLPCFNSNVLEHYMHKIPGLTEQFVYFNDDFFIINDVPQERFFQDGMPCDIAVFRFNTGLSQWEKMLKNNIKLINKHFNKNETLKRHFDKWYNPTYGKKIRMNYIFKPYNKFATLCTPHNAQSFLKTTFDDVWENCREELQIASANRFRKVTDLTPELFRTWQICQGNFSPRNLYADTKMFPLIQGSKKAIRAIRQQSYSLICLNDNVHIRNYSEVMTNIQAAFESILPEKSSFEK
jgi:hypothetical protein